MSFDTVLMLVTPALAIAIIITQLSIIYDFRDKSGFDTIYEKSKVVFYSGVLCLLMPFAISMPSIYLFSRMTCQIVFFIAVCVFLVHMVYVLISSYKGRLKWFILPLGVMIFIVIAIVIILILMAIILDEYAKANLLTILILLQLVLYPIIGIAMLLSNLLLIRQLKVAPLINAEDVAP